MDPFIRVTGLILFMLLFFPFAPLGFGWALMYDWYDTQLSKKLLKQAPLFPKAVIVALQGEKMLCKFYRSPHYGQIRPRYGVFTTYVPTVQNLVVGDTIFLLPESFDLNNSQVEMKATKESVTLRRFEQELSFMITKTTL